MTQLTKEKTMPDNPLRESLLTAASVAFALCGILFLYWLMPYQPPQGW
jgi:hypothetical protein